MVFVVQLGFLRTSGNLLFSGNLRFFEPVIAILSTRVEDVAFVASIEDGMSLPVGEITRWLQAIDNRITSAK